MLLTEALPGREQVRCSGTRALTQRGHVEGLHSDCEGNKTKQDSETAIIKAGAMKA